MLTSSKTFIEAEKTGMLPESKACRGKKQPRFFIISCSSIIMKDATHLTNTIIHRFSIDYNKIIFVADCQVISDDSAASKKGNNKEMSLAYKLLIVLL